MIYNIDHKEVESISNEQITWKVHYVNDFMEKEATFKDDMCDCHSHGIKEYLGKELQIVLRFEPELVLYLINSIGKLATAGYKFEDKDEIYGLFQDPNMPVYIMASQDVNGEDILRICLPDPKGEANPELAEGIYKKQTEHPYLKAEPMNIVHVDFTTGQQISDDSE